MFYATKSFSRRLTDICAIVAICFLLKLIYLGRVSTNSSRSTGALLSEGLSRCERAGRADDETPISAPHVYSPSGLLHVNPDGIHPILALVRSAEDEWDRKLDRASRTLEEAVREYKRRYRRDPPAGFDDWWDFAQEMDAQLPDEYDTMYRELEPFWGMDPADLATIQAAQETRHDTFTILKNITHDTHLITTAFSDPENWEQKGLLRGLEEIITLLDPIEPALRPFRAPPWFFGWTADGSTLEDDPEWENKTDERLLWRGSNVGMVNSDATRWRDAHRSRLVWWADDVNGTASVLLPGRVEDEGWQRVGTGTLVKKALLNPVMFDIAFSGKPMGCDVQFCRYLETQFEWRKQRDQERETRKHKFVLDVDGNGPSLDFKRLMSSNSLVFKSTVYPQWYVAAYRSLRP
ncbi:hypothetical protein C0991_001558 [Blastosporella zonata]|nr:hypothetical protein C0991_001558 [Blastosporella zonata]